MADDGPPDWAPVETVEVVQVEHTDSEIVEEWARNAADRTIAIRELPP